MTAAAQLIGIIAGSLAIVAALWQISRAIYRKARVSEELRDAIVGLLVRHELRIRHLEER